MAYQPKSFRKFLATSVTTAVVATAVAPIGLTSVAAAQFTDVPSNAWYAEAVNELAAAGVLGGVGNNKFDPNSTVTRAQAFAALSKAFQLDEENAPKHPFTDVPAGHWAEGAINALYAEGIIVGDGGKSLLNSSLTREQLVAMLLRALEIEEDPSATHSFTDVPAGHWAEKAIATAVEYGITDGVGNGKFGLGQTATRAELAGFLYKDNVRDSLPAWQEYKQGTVSGDIKAINATTVEVTLDEDVTDVKASDFEIDGLDVINAVVKQGYTNVVVLTTSEQEGGKVYTLKYKGQTVGTFQGISAVIPTKIEVVEDAVQGIVGKQVTLKADIGQKQAGVPVTFNVDAANNSLNQDIVQEVYTDENGIATFTYTQYNAGWSDDVAVYPTGAPAVRDHATVWWGVDTILKLEADDDKGNELKNGETKRYKITYKDPKTGKVVEGKEIHLTFAENVDVNINEITKATVNGVTPYQLNNGNKEYVTVKTDSKGEATVTVSGTNTEATLIAFVDGSGSTSNEKNKLERTELQVKAETVKFSAVHLKYEIEVTRDGGEEAAIGENNGRKYIVKVKDENGNPAKNEVVNVAFDEDLDRAISTETEAYFYEDPDNKGKRVNKLFRNNNNSRPMQIALTLDSNGEGEFLIVSNNNKDYATPVVWIDINTSSNKEGNLDNDEPKKVAGITYFADQKISGSRLKVYEVNKDGSTGAEVKDNRTIDAGDFKAVKFEFKVANQSGKEYTGGSVKDFKASYQITNTGTKDVYVWKNLADVGNISKADYVVSTKRSVTVDIDGIGNTANLYIGSNGETASVEVKAYGKATYADGADKDKVVNLSESKVAKATFKSTADVGTTHRAVVASFDRDKKKLRFIDKAEEIDYKNEYNEGKVRYYDARTGSVGGYVEIGADQFEKELLKVIENPDNLATNVEVQYYKNSNGDITFSITRENVTTDIDVVVDSKLAKSGSIDLTGFTIKNLTVMEDNITVNNYRAATDATLTVVGKKATVNGVAAGTSVKKLTVDGDVTLTNVSVTGGAGSDLTIKGNGSSITGLQTTGGDIATATVNGDNITIKGSGNIDNLTVKGKGLVLDGVTVDNVTVVATGGVSGSMLSASFVKASAEDVTSKDVVVLTGNAGTASELKFTFKTVPANQTVSITAGGTKATEITLQNGAQITEVKVTFSPSVKANYEVSITADGKTDTVVFDGTKWKFKG